MAWGWDVDAEYIESMSNRYSNVSTSDDTIEGILIG